MKKIPTLFIRNEKDMSRVLPIVDPGCQWVLDGEGVAHQKLDGTSCMIKDCELYKRREVKFGRERPDGFIEVGYTNGKTQGWVPVDQMDRWHNAAFLILKHTAEKTEIPIKDGTYELIGPKVQGNPENFPHHALKRHDQTVKYPDAPRTYEELAEWFRDMDIEGIVWHHDDGRYAKIKGKDFGHKRGK